MTETAERVGLAGAVEALRRASSVAVVSHRDPDGDTVGAAIALGLGLEGAGKRVSFHCADPIPDTFQFLDAAKRYRQDAPAGVDLVVTVDFGDSGRGKFALPPGPLVNIDHHATNDRFGTVNVVDDRSPATAELVGRVIDAAGLRWTPEMATAALLGIMTDTGSFQFPSTDPECHRRAAQLLAAGADLPSITKNVFRTRPFAALKLFGLAFARLESERDGRLVHTWVREQDFLNVGAHPEDVSGLVEQVARSKGMRVTILFNEEQPGAVKISIRTSADPPSVDAAALATRFGGGGHVRAAGAQVPGALDDVRQRVLDAARAALGV